MRRKPPRLPGSVSGDHRPPAPAQIEAGSQDTLAFANVDIVVEHPCRRDERERARSKVVVVIFDQPGQVIGEGIFTADTNGPTAARLIRRRDQYAGEQVKSVVVVALPCTTALHVAEEAVPAIPDPGGPCGSDLTRVWLVVRSTTGSALEPFASVQA